MSAWIGRHPRASMLLLLFGVVTIVAFWQVFLLLGLLAAAGYCLYRFTRSYDQSYQLARARRQQLAAHADYEHHLWEQGDPRGFYGQYQPYC